MEPTVAAPQPKAPVASAAEEEQVHECPKGTSGKGSMKTPCEAKGKERMMQVTWTGKMSDDGPSFRVTNTSKTPILYGRMAAYFYDKAGKQLEVPASGKKATKQWCGGNIFEGQMKAGEKATITFSCVKKEHVPEGMASIEAEMQTVGFADSSGEKSEYYWRNNDLTPDARPKGGIK